MNNLSFCDGKMRVPGREMVTKDEERVQLEELYVDELMAIGSLSID